MKNKVIILISFITIILLIIGIIAFNNSNKINNLLYEKYGENFEIVFDGGDEYESGLFPTFKKTGYKNLIASPKNNKEIKFDVRLKLNPLEIVRDDYISANIAYNTSKKIETNYRIGNKIYVHTSAAEYECDGKITDSFFDNINGQGSIGISIYVGGLDNYFNYTEYLNGILKDLNFDSMTKGAISLYFIKENGIEKIKNYYKKSKDRVEIENSGSFDVLTKYFKTTNKDYFIKF